MKRLFLISLLMGLTWVCLAQAAGYDWQKEGERLTFDVRFLGLRAGQAEVLYQPHETDATYYVSARAWTTPAVGSFIYLRDRLFVEGAHLEAAPFMPISYTLNLYENDYRANKRVQFDAENGRAVYENMRNTLGPVTLDVPENVRDMLSALYAFRAQLKDVPLKTGEVYKTPVVDLDSQYILELRILERTTLNGVPVLHVQPALRGVKDKNAKDRWHLWVSDDGQYVPVRIEVDMRVGSFRAHLTHSRVAASQSQAPKELPEAGDFTFERRKHIHGEATVD